MARKMIMALLAVSALLANGIKSEEKKIDPVPGLSTYTDMQRYSVRDVYIHSPWNPAEYACLGLPEHCWGYGLPNTSHNSAEPMASPWRFNADSTAAWYENVTRPGVIYRARVDADSMAVHLTATIVNRTDQPIKDIRSLVCLRPAWKIGGSPRPDAMLGFRDTSFSRTWIWVDRKPQRLGQDTHYEGDIPDKSWPEDAINCFMNWGVNVKGGPDNSTLSDLEWFRGKSPGRIVDERADPPLIAINDSEHEDRWLATIWNPARVLFSNPRHPCFHSDPMIPDCPAQDSVSVHGIVFFHQGTLDGLLARTEDWLASMK